MVQPIQKFLDIREDVCPITFVKTRLLIESMSSGENAELLLRGSEPIENVPSSVEELGHEVLVYGKISEFEGEKPGSFEAEDVRMVIRKA